MNPLIFLVCASLVETVAACLGGIRNYALAVGVISLLVSVLLWVLQNKKPETLLKVLFTLPKVGAVSVELLIADFLFVWWCVGAGIMTFQGPFTVTTNGYFATWAALAASAFIAGEVTPIINDANGNIKALSVDGTPLVTLLICAFIVLFAALQNLATWEPMLMLACAAVAILYSVLLLVASDKFTAQQQQMAASIMLLVWCTEAGIGTFHGPFIVTSNGFFASWVGLMACLFATRAHLPEAMVVVNARESKATRDSVSQTKDVAITMERA